MSSAKLSVGMKEASLEFPFVSPVILQNKSLFMLWLFLTSAVLQPFRMGTPPSKKKFTLPSAQASMAVMVIVQQYSLRQIV